MVATGCGNKVSLAKLLWDGDPSFEPLDFEPDYQGVPRQFMWFILQVKAVTNTKIINDD